MDFFGLKRLLTDRAASLPISKGPLLDRRSFALDRRSTNGWLTRADSGRFVSSGRAAIFWSLKLLGVGANDAVLVPSYHCPTVVAPVVALGAAPVFYPLAATGLPDLARIDATAHRAVRAIVVPQLFGLPCDLAAVREWCDRMRIPMIEDCAHTLVGRAGERAAGQWGDFATASLAKLLPVRELGWLSSHLRLVPKLAFRPSGWRSEIRGAMDPVQIAAAHGRLSALGWLVRRLLPCGSCVDPDGQPPRALLGEVEAMRSSDLARVQDAPAATSRLIAWAADFDRIASARRRNYARMAQIFRSNSIGRVLVEQAPDDSAPYVLPVLVDEGEELYRAMRRIGFPAYRWDRLWPGTPTLTNDVAPLWWRNLLQIPVHQSYSDDEFARLGAMLDALRLR